MIKCWYTIYKIPENTVDLLLVYAHEYYDSISVKYILFEVTLVMVHDHIL